METHEPASDELEDFLAHYGVKGMKWGVRKAERRDKSVQKQTAKLKKTAAKYEMKRGTKEELLAEREKVQKKISRMDPDKAYQSMNALGSSNSRKSGFKDLNGKTAFQNLTAQEKHNVNQMVRKRQAAIFVGKSAALTTLTSAAVVGGGEGYMRLTGMSPETRANGRKALGGFMAVYGGQSFLSDMSMIRTDYKRSKLEDRRHEIDKQLAGKW